MLIEPEDERAGRCLLRRINQHRRIELSKRNPRGPKRRQAVVGESELPLCISAFAR